MEQANQVFTHLFRTAGEVLRENRDALNAADTVNGNHGDHMVAVFDAAAQAVEQLPHATLADVLQTAAALLARQTDNGSAQVYARGLMQMAQQFSRHDISVDDLLAFVRKTLADTGAGEIQGMARPAGVETSPADRSAVTLKALVNALVDWNSSAQPGSKPLGAGEANRAMDMNALFDLGIAYMQAKARGGGRSQVLADAAASASPLKETPHRYQSGKMVIQTLLDAMAGADLSWRQ